MAAARKKKSTAVSRAPSARNAPRNRAAEAKKQGRKLAMFEISGELDSLIEQVRETLAKRMMGKCSRLQALEHMGREGARAILKKD